MTAPYIPVPVGVGWCTDHQANVAIDERGRCPEHRSLAIWPEGRPRPPMVTETLIRLKRAETQGGRHRPLNARQLRVVR